MKDPKYRILQVVAKKPVGGVGTFLMNSYLDNENFIFDVIESSENYEGSFNEFFINRGAKIFLFPEVNSRNFKIYWKKCEKFYHKYHEIYDIVHVHSPSIALPHLYHAQKYGIKVRIYHSHNTRYSDSFLKSLRNKALVDMSLKYANTFFSCGLLAGEKIFKSKNFKIIPNGVPLDNFRFKYDVREKIRKHYNIPEDIYLVGIVGSVNKIKNQKFILEVAKKVLNNKKILFFVIGDGNLREQLENDAIEQNVSNVKFLGRKENVSSFYNAMDCLVIPSLFEGFPLVSVEAQANGLPIVAADTIDKTIKLTNQVFFLPIKGNTAIMEWANKIQLLQRNVSLNISSRVSNLKDIEGSGYSIKDSSDTLFLNYQQCIDFYCGKDKL
ncbi:glycosyltransferase [Enterococcus faecalis]|uniref:glycosyltransferase n=1 Tax=Enterococcus faecalis TaxID=1351 RepID=UPI000CF1A6C4|nr:glycosyltransferase [Enterococcus faecalis]PQC45132.1 hypothetical protein CUM89_04160 [Enterococcus faecalis]PQF97074.1 hypothetical protein CUS50_11565 [Enterococcus faecalis]ROX67733.1 glycosyltransferase family 1 protein [Enterococcus faecalis]ROX95615.1 glycosyltransferase family 1 protein [Enterococcus faecalis]ROY35265.1 glycosyltransferase family 1 protein [Enterococcus faecalis]